MSATRLTRSAVLRRLLRLIAASDDLPIGVTVHRGMPRGGPDSDLIASGDIAGDEISTPTMRSGRKATRDQYTIQLFCVAFVDGDDQFDDADDQAERLAEVVRAVLVDSPQLVDLTDRDEPDLCVTSAQISLADGPSPWHVDTGSASLVTLYVAVDQRIN